MTRVQLGEICERLSSGKSIKAVEIQDLGPYPVIGGNGLRGYAERYNFDGECTVIGRQGAACGNVRFHSGKAYMTEHAVVAVANESSDSHYLAYLLSTMNLGRLSAQSAQPGLSVKTLSKQEIYLPPLEKQKQVVEVLGRIDAKIESNAKLNGYLEELLLAKCADLENAVEESCTVGDYCKRIYSGGTPSTKIPSYWNGTLPWLSSGETRARFIIGAEKTITPEGIEGSSTKLANRGSIVMASAGQGFTRGQTSMLLFDTYVNQSVVVMVPEEKCGSYLLFALAARYEELRAWSDSTSTRGSLSGKILRRFALPCLTKEQLERFESLANPLIRVIESNLRESKSLAELRDALLPKLMSGEIDVSKVDLTQLNSHLA